MTFEEIPASRDLAPMGDPEKAHGQGTDEPGEQDQDACKDSEYDPRTGPEHVRSEFGAEGCKPLVQFFPASDHCFFLFKLKDAFGIFPNPLQNYIPAYPCLVFFLKRLTTLIHIKILMVISIVPTNPLFSEWLGQRLPPLRILSFCRLKWDYFLYTGVRAG